MLLSNEKVELILFMAAPVKANLCKSLHGASGCRVLPAVHSQISVPARGPMDFCLVGAAQVQHHVCSQGERMEDIFVEICSCLLSQVLNEQFGCGAIDTKTIISQMQWSFHPTQGGKAPLFFSVLLILYWDIITQDHGSYPFSTAHENM